MLNPKLNASGLASTLILVAADVRRLHLNSRISEFQNILTLGRLFKLDRVYTHA